VILHKAPPVNLVIIEIHEVNLVHLPVWRLGRVKPFSDVIEWLPDIHVKDVVVLKNLFAVVCFFRFTGESHVADKVERGPQVVPLEVQGPLGFLFEFTAGAVSPVVAIVFSAPPPARVISLDLASRKTMYRSLCFKIT
jgi:hypothetical protein